MKTAYFTVFAALLLSACATQAPAPVIDRSTPRAGVPLATPAAAPVPSGPGYYTVKRGDTLYRIALEHGQAYRDVAAWNNITNPASISEGQVLRVAPPGGEGTATALAQPVVSSAVVETRPLDAAQPARPLAADGVRRDPKVNKEPYSDAAYEKLQNPGGAVAAATSAEAPKPAESKPAEAVTAGPDDVAWAWPSAGKILDTFNDSSNKGIDFAGKAGDPVLAAGEGRVVYAGAGLRGYGQLVIIKHNATFLSAYAHNQKILVKEGDNIKRGQKIAELGNTDSENGVYKLHFEIRRQGKPVDPAGYLPKR
ncbi:MAG TPA: peptidoglycan DD-metalloendopeptidase family protein [Rhodocyclaceae bacterium]|nr:peptidoglycan DD-metalloendopeptidase family protein [Rhodocyclaceae bacterium]